MEQLCTVDAVAIEGGRRITRQGVLARLIAPQGSAAG